MYYPNTRRRPPNRLPTKLPVNAAPPTNTAAFKGCLLGVELTTTVWGTGWQELYDTVCDVGYPDEYPEEYVDDEYPPLQLHGYV